MGGERVTYTDITSIWIYGRSTYSTNDIRSVSAFITSDDPSVRRSADYVQRLVEDAAHKPLDANIQKTIALHALLSFLEIRCAPGPDPGLRTSSPASRSIGRLQLPGETLMRGQGNRQDLAVLFCALLEASGVETALIAAADSFYPAFAIQEPPASVIASARYPDRFLYQKGKAWIPLDPTRLGDDFLDAWESGMTLWREYRRSDGYAFIPTHDAWLAYEPPEITIPSDRIALPTVSALRDTYRDQFDKVWNRGL
jgi:hypothetical protein